MAGFSIDLYWSFRSPYSYLAVKQLAPLRRRWDFDITPRIVLPIAVRDPDRYARNLNQAWMDYTIRDVARLAEMMNLRVALPSPDPVVIDPQTKQAASEQPHIHRLSRLGVAASEMGRGLSFIDEVSTLIWSGEAWTEEDRLADAAARAGLDLAELEKRIDAHAERFDILLADNQAALEAAGHWGVPTMVFEDEPFFGQDRIPVLLWRMRQKGLSERTG